MTKFKRKRKPTSPGEILREEFLEPLGLTQKQLAEHLGVDVKAINRIVNEKSSVTPIMAIKLAHAFRMTANFWLNAQTAMDIYNAELDLEELPEPLVG